MRAPVCASARAPTGGAGKSEEGGARQGHVANAIWKLSGDPDIGADVHSRSRCGASASPEIVKVARHRRPLAGFQRVGDVDLARHGRYSRRSSPTLPSA
jgi:hypothetical protein